MLFKSRFWGSWFGTVLKARRGGSVGRPATTSRNPQRRRRGTLVGVEALEARLVPAVITVNSLADTVNHNDGVLTLCEALNVTNQPDIASELLAFAALSTAERSQFDNVTSSLGTNDEIRFGVNGTLSMNPMAPAEFLISRSVTINGPGADLLTLNAKAKSRVFEIASGANVTIRGLTLTNGFDTNGGAIFNSGTLRLDGVNLLSSQGSVSGGGIFNQGTLFLNSSTINSCFTRGAGGAVFNQGTLNVNASTISENFAFSGAGGIANQGTGNANQESLRVTNSTFNNNNGSVGGAIGNASGGVATVINSTFVGNTATGTSAAGGAINNAGKLSVISCTITANFVSGTEPLGGGVFGASGATTRLYNSIIVNNFHKANVLDDVAGVSDPVLTFGNLVSQTVNPVGLTGLGHNLVPGQFYALGNFTFTPSSAFPADVFDGRGLQFNGGTTKTVALKAGSPAIGSAVTGENPKDALGNDIPRAFIPTDQRSGFSRVIGGTQDLGAVEFIPETLVVDTLSDGIDGDFSAGHFSLREAVMLANVGVGAQTITFAPSLSGTITLNGEQLTLNDPSGKTTIQGPGANRLTIDGDQKSRVFQITNSAKAEISGLTIQKGNAADGGGILLDLGTELSLANAIIRNNHARFNGGGIKFGGSRINATTLFVTNSTFDSNVSDVSGGGIFGGLGQLNVSNSTFVGNQANGAPHYLPTGTLNFDFLSGGGGILLSNVFATIINSTLTQNSTASFGGGLAIFDPETNKISIVNCTLTGNTVGTESLMSEASQKGAGLFVSENPLSDTASRTTDGNITVRNTIVAGNVVEGTTTPADYHGPAFQGAFSGNSNFGGVNAPTSGNGMSKESSLIGGIDKFDATKIFAGGLADNGGPTKTIALLNSPFNPAFGQGRPDNNVLTDQRGFLRSTNRPSIGAFEPNLSKIVVTTTADEDNGTIVPTSGTGTSLREAVNYANAQTVPTTITFADSVRGVITLPSQLILTNSQKITLQGPGADKLTLDIQRRSRLLYVQGTSTVVEVSGLTFQNGFVEASTGGAIYNEGTLKLTGIVAQNNETRNGNAGGAIANTSGAKMILENSTLFNNVSNFAERDFKGFGGGIVNDGTLTVLGSSIVNNGAGTGGGLYNVGAATIINSTFVKNVAQFRGGALFNLGTLTLINDSIAANTSTTGSGLFTDATRPSPAPSSTAFNTILSGNVNFDFVNLGSPVEQTSSNVGGRALASGSSNNLIGGDVTKIFETTSDGPKLANNGGPTQTLALIDGSPAIDAGDIAKIPLDLFIDQRGFGRLSGARIDIGAFEKVGPVDLALVLKGPEQVAATPPHVGDVVTFHVNVGNFSTTTNAANVVLTINIPEGTQFKSLDHVGGELLPDPQHPDPMPGTLGGTITRVASSFGANVFLGYALNVKVMVRPPNGMIVLSANFTTASVDSDTTNNSRSISIPVEAAPPPPQVTFATQQTIQRTSVGVPVTTQIQFSGPINPDSITTDDFRGSGSANSVIQSVTPASDDHTTFNVTFIPQQPGFTSLALSDTAEFSFGDNQDDPNTFTPVSLLEPAIEVSDTLFVDSADDVDDGDFTTFHLSLREAIRLANEHPGDDKIEFALKPDPITHIIPPITLTQGELAVTDTEGLLRINGPEGGTQVIQRATNANHFRIFRVDAGAQANLSYLTIANGFSDDNGGGIHNSGAVSVDHSTLINNQAANGGGAIYNHLFANFSRSTLTGNSADNGGAAFNDNADPLPSIDFSFCTVSGNSARSNGGGIYNVGDLTFAGSTLVLNQADSNGDGSGDGGGIAAFNQELLVTSIVAGNTRGTGNTKTNSDIGGGFIDSADHSLVADNPTGGNVHNGVNGNIVGINGDGTIPLSSILNPTLANNGGPTLTHALVPLSLARDAGNTDFNGGTDQLDNPNFNNVDIGAFEYKPPTPTTGIALLANTNTTIFVAEGNTLVLPEIFSGPNTANLIKTGTGTLVLAGANTYLGGTAINAGTLRVQTKGGLGTGTGSKGTIVAAGATLDVKVDSGLINETLTLNGQGFGGVGALSLSNGFPTWSGTISLAGNTTIGVAAGNALTISSVISPATGAATKGLTKVGGGQLILNAANTYTGPTTINEGELTINGSQPKSNVSLNGGTLSGKGTTAGVTFVAGLPTAPHIAPGFAPGSALGKLTQMGNLVLSSSSTFDVQIGGVTIGTQLDNINVTGTVNLNNAILSPKFVNDFGNSTNANSTKVNNKYTIITNDKTDKVVGTFNGLAEGATFLVNTVKFQITYKGGDGNDVVLTHVNTNSAFSHRSVTPVIDEGGIATLQGTIVEVDPRDSFTLTINWGDGHHEVQFFPAGSSGKLVTLTHRYLEGRANPYDIALDWRDQHGGGKSDHLSVQVNSVAPTADISGPDTVIPGALKRFQFAAVDPTPIDQFGAMQWTIDWGDGTSISTSRRGNFSLSHVFKEPGDYIIRATARDNDGATSPIVIHRVHAEPIGGMASLLPQTLGDLLMTV